MSSLKLDLRIVLYAPGLARVGVLPTDSISMTDPNCAVPSVTFALSELVYAQLPDLVEVAVEYWSGTAWTEPRNCRFMVEKDDIDDKSLARVKTLTGLGLIPWLMARYHLQVAGVTLVGGKRMFNSATAGNILLTILQEGQTYGWGVPLSWDFTNTTDSAGVAWAAQASLGYDEGIDAWTIMQNLSDQGLIDFATQGRLLHVWNPNHGVDLSTGTALVRIGTRSSSLPIKRDASFLVTNVIVRGEAALLLDLPSGLSIPGLGKITAFIKQGGVTDTGTATLLAQPRLIQGAQVRQELTSKDDAQQSIYLPWANYQTGDWVSGYVRGVYIRVRVQQLTVAKSSTGVTIGVTLNDRFIDAEVRLAKRTVGIIGGSGVGGAGGTPSTIDNRVPAAPTGLTLVSTGYWSGNIAMSQVAATWTAVTQGIDSVAISISGYEVWIAPQGSTNWTLLTSTTVATATGSPFTPGTQWQFKVRARTVANVLGDYSTAAVVTMQTPNFTLNAPTSPILTSKNGVVIVSWDGNFATTPLTLAPSYYLQMNIEAADVQAGPYSLIGTLVTGAAQTSFSGIVGSTKWIRFTALDTLGRPSTSSTPVSVVVVGLSGADLIVNTVNGNTITAGTLTADRLTANAGSQLDISANSSVTIAVGNVNALSSTVAANGTAAQTTAANLATMQTYYQFGANALTIGRPGSNIAFQLSNAGAQILESGTPTSTWSSGLFKSNSVVTGLLDLGHHQITTSGTNGTVIRVV